MNLPTITGKRLFMVLGVCFCVLLLLANSATLSEQDETTKALTVKVLNYNIFGEDSAQITQIGNLIESYQPDIIAFQEVYSKNIIPLMQRFPQYDWFGPTQKGDWPLEPCIGDCESIRPMYNKERFTLDSTNSGAFWYCEQPAEPGCLGWGAPYDRYCIYIRLVDNTTNQGLYLYNSHWEFGSRGQVSRDSSAYLLAHRIANRAYPNEPFLVTGDFNTSKNKSSIQYLLNDPENPTPMEIVVYDRIDGILSGPGSFEIISSQIDNNKDASDHPAVMAEIKFIK